VAIQVVGGAAAEQRAARLERVVTLPTVELAEAALVLEVGEDDVRLRVVEGDPRLVGGKAVRVDLTKLDTTSGPGRSLRLPLLKAVGIRKGDRWRPRVIDATAGLGEDAWLLASAGCEVRACERNPFVAALLRDGLDRARAAEPEVAGRVVLVGPDLREVDPGASTRVDVICLDPMYPGHAKRKTAERKPLAVLRMLAGDDADADGLLDPALAMASRRVVVKRPRGAPPLAGRAPTVVHTARGHRFDVYAVG